MRLAIFNSSGIVVPSDPIYGPLSGKFSSNLKVLEDALLIIKGKKIENIVPESKINALRRDGGLKEIDAHGGIVLPGFIDSHTHIAFAGSRENEFYMKAEGKTYSEIQASGGGIYRTFSDVGITGFEGIMAQTLMRIAHGIMTGTTSFEVKTGYGSDDADEMKLLQVAEKIGNLGIANIRKTFLGLHVVPSGMSENEYAEHICKNLLPRIADRVDFTDIFCDRGAFGLESLAMIAEASSLHSIPLRVHANEIEDIGCVQALKGRRIASADHLLHVDDGDLDVLKSTGGIATLLPSTAFSMSPDSMPDFTRFSSKDIPVALASDCSPSTYTTNLFTELYLAVRFCRMPVQAALNGITVNAAFSLGLESQTGWIEPGKLADVNVLDVDDYRKLPYQHDFVRVRHLLKSGRLLIKDFAPEERLMRALNGEWAKFN